jgi:hypothetical protein
MAGESARDVARRRREKADRLNRMADAYERGAQGEEATAQALKALPRDWVVMHDVRWPGRRFANIDHVVIGPGGVFVIDSKLWAGSLTIVDDVLRVNGYKRETAVYGVADSAIAVSELIPGIDPYLVKPVLCFVRDQHVTGWLRDVMVCSTANVVGMLTSRSAVLSSERIRELAALFSAQLSPATRRGTSAASTPPSRVPRTGARPRGPSGPAAVAGAVVLGTTGAAKGLRLLAKLVVGVLPLVLMVLLLTHLDVLSKGAADVITKQLEPSVPLGRPVMIRGTATRPALELTADRLVKARSRGTGSKPAHGMRLLAVRLELAATGSETYRRGPQSIATLVDRTGVRYHPDPTFRQTSAGRALPEAVRVRPGRRVTGYLIFPVPRRAVISRVEYAVDLAYGGTARWDVPGAPGR